MPRYLCKTYFLDLSPSIRIKDWWPKTNTNISQSLSIRLDDSYFWFFIFHWTNTRYRNTSPANNCLYNAGHIFRSTCSTLKLLCRVSTVCINRQKGLLFDVCYVIECYYVMNGNFWFIFGHFAGYNAFGPILYYLT